MKPTTEQIEKWKAEHGCIEFEIDGLVCYMRRPSLKIMKAAFSQMQTSELLMKETLINNCWLSGDEQIRRDEEYFLALADEILKIFETADYEIERKASSVVVKIEDKSCELRKPTREDIRKAEERNKRKMPFDTQIFLLDAIWITGDEELRTNETWYLALLAAVNEIKTSKFASIKKY